MVIRYYSKLVPFFSKQKISFGWLKHRYEASQKIQLLIVDDSFYMTATTDIPFTDEF